MGHGVGMENKQTNEKELATLHGGPEDYDGDLEMDTGSYGFGNYYFCLYFVVLVAQFKLVQRFDYYTGTDHFCFH